jgi:tRNA(Ile)-lysidine synthase
VAGSVDPLVADLLCRTAFPASGTAVVCAVSGGADSLSLMVLAAAHGLAVTAVHVDHGLRPNSAADAEVVANAAQRFGVSFRAMRVVVASGPNLEARARAARHEALGPDALLGHTMDDQAETVLLALLRGSGLDGLSAMRPQRHPLLGLRRAETLALCDAVGLVPVVDPSNDDPRFRRNRVRHELLPLVCAVAERDVVPVLARQARVLRDEADLLDALAAQLDPTDARAVAAAEPALARRALRRWLADPYPPDSEGLERVLAVARGEFVACELAGGVTIRRSGQRLERFGARGAEN